MATTIVTKSGSGAPAASDLVAGELAVDLTNKRLYTENSGGTVLELGTNPTTLAVDTDTLVVDATNNRVGIGTSSPNYPIHVEKSVDGDWMGKIKNTHATNGYGLLIHAGDDASVTALSVANYAGAGSYLVVKGDGNVGIGVAAPLDMLHLKGADPSIRFEDISGDAYAKIEADSADEGSIRIQADAGNSGANSIIRFDIDGGEKARLTATGLGIGETSPLAKVHIKEGDSGVNSISSNFDQLVLEDDLHSGMHILSGTESDGAIYFGDSGNSSAGQLKYLHSSDAMVINTNDTERLRIGASGSVGISNSIASDFNAGANTLVVGSGSGSKGMTIYGSTQSNIFFADGTAGTAAYIGRIEYSHSADSMQFYVNNSLAMTIDSDLLTTLQGRITMNGGNAASPGISEKGDLNTGIYWPSADNLGFSIGGTAKAFISATQFNMTGNGVFSGSITKGSGSFKIDHPLPEKTETHHLIHSFVESPQADNIYRGKVDLVDGSTTVNIDDAAGMTEGTYVLLNTNTQCFTSNESGWTAVKGSVSGNILTITAQESCTDTISWMVVGERHDQHMLDTEWTDENGKVIVEPLKES